MTAPNPKNLDRDTCLGIIDRIGMEDEDELFGQIVNCFGSDLQRFAMHRCSNAADAEDVVQDTLVAAYRYLEGFRGDSTLKTWLFKLAASACTKKRRGLKNSPNLHVEFDPALLKSEQQETEEAETSLLVREKFEKLTEALYALSEEDREMLLLHQGEGLSLESLAERFELSVSAIKSRLFRSRKKLRDELSQVGLAV